MSRTVHVWCRQDSDPDSRTVYADGRPIGHIVHAGRNRWRPLDEPGTAPMSAHDAAWAVTRRHPATAAAAILQVGGGCDS
jgi:hypothetical protein